MATRAAPQPNPVPGRLQQPVMDFLGQRLGRMDLDNPQGWGPSNLADASKQDPAEPDNWSLYEGYELWKATPTAKNQRPTWKEVRKIKMPFASEQLLSHIKTHEQQKDHDKELMDLYNSLSDAKKRAINELIQEKEAEDNEAEWKLAGLKLHTVKAPRKVVDIPGMQVILKRRCRYPVPRANKPKPSMQPGRQDASFGMNDLRQQNLRQPLGHHGGIPTGPNLVARDEQMKPPPFDPAPIRSRQENQHPPPPPPPPPPMVNPQTRTRQGQHDAQPPIIVVPEFPEGPQIRQRIPQPTAHPKPAGFDAPQPLRSQTFPLGGNRQPGGGIKQNDLNNHKQPDMKQQRHSFHEPMKGIGTRRESPTNGRNPQQRDFHNRDFPGWQKSPVIEAYDTETDSDEISSSHTYATDDTSDTSQNSEPEISARRPRHPSTQKRPNSAGRPKGHDESPRQERHYRQHSRQASHPSYYREGIEMVPGPGPQRPHTSAEYPRPSNQRGARPSSTYAPVVDQEPAFAGRDPKRFSNPATMGPGFSSGNGFGGYYESPRPIPFGAAIPRHAQRFNDERAHYYH